MLTKQEIKTIKKFGKLLKARRKFNCSMPDYLDKKQDYLWSVNDIYPALIKAYEKFCFAWALDNNTPKYPISFANLKNSVDYDFESSFFDKSVLPKWWEHLSDGNNWHDAFKAIHDIWNRAVANAQNTSKIIIYLTTQIISI